MRITHFAWNLGGLTVPLLIAAVTIPRLIGTLGNERFGLLALAWGLIGYAGVMDLGIGRALTQIVSKMRGERILTDIPSALATAERITMVSGLVGATVISIVALSSLVDMIVVHETSNLEIKQSTLLLAVALPAQAMSATYRGFNEAFLNFKGINILRAALGAINFAGPYAISFFTIQLPWLVASLVISRLIALFCFRLLAKNCLENDINLNAESRYSPAIARLLLKFGGWVTISNVVSPILVQADRFFIASMISASAVSVYVIPYELVVQSLVVVGAVSSVMFPALSKLKYENSTKYLDCFRLWLKRTVSLMAVICIFVALFLPIILPLWIQRNLDPMSVQIGQILCFGVFANSIGSMFYNLLHTSARVDITAKIHLVELPLFIAALYLVTPQFGLLGVAYVWCGRMVVDTLALAIFSDYAIKGIRIVK